MGVKKSTKKESSLFKPAKTANKKSSLKVIEGKKLAKQIDEFKDLNNEIKALKANQDVLKSGLMEFGDAEFCKNLATGMGGNLKLLGNESEITYIAQNSSSLLTEEQIEEAKTKLDKKLVEKLTVVDYSSIKINSEIFEAHAEKIEKALIKTLGIEVASQLFNPPSYKVKSNVLDQLSDENEETIAEALDALKIKRYIKG